MFIVLLTANRDGSRAFYERLGYPSREERHGQGPVHYAGIVDRTLFELYPPLQQAPGEAMFIGINTAENTSALKEELIGHFAGIRPEPDIHVTKSGIATLRDPGGTLVKLFPKAGL